MALQFVNYLGNPVSTLANPSSRKPESSAPSEFHKGHRVMGLPPNAIESARIEHEKLQANKPPGEYKPFDPAFWVMNTRKKPVRSALYAVREAAEQCADLATKAGWTHVEIVTIEKRKGE